MFIALQEILEVAYHVRAATSKDGNPNDGKELATSRKYFRTVNRHSIQYIELGL